tara:strand:- start:238 stop:549 length:312 start_codon:yes stop_codon:yes gene_type:complete
MAPRGVERFLHAPPFVIFLETGEKMSNNIIQFPGKEKLNDLDLEPNDMLEAIMEEVEMTEAMVIGWTKDGNLFLGTSHGKAPDMLFLMELAKTVLVDRCISDD